VASLLQTLEVSRQSASHLGNTYCYWRYCVNSKDFATTFTTGDCGTATSDSSDLTKLNKQASADQYDSESDKSTNATTSSLGGDGGMQIGGGRIIQRAASQED
jgi:hypothetical protein